MLFFAVLVAFLLTAFAYGLSRYSWFAPAILTGMALCLLSLSPVLYYAFWLAAFPGVILLLIGFLLIFRRVYKSKTVSNLDWIDKITYSVASIMVAYLASLVVQAALLSADDTLFLSATFFVLAIELSLVPYLFLEKQRLPAIRLRKTLILVCIVIPLFPVIIYTGSSQVLAQVVSEGNAKKVFPFLYLNQALGYEKKTREALFLEAAVAGNADLLTDLLEQGVDVNTSNEVQITALHQVISYAPREKVLPLVQLLHQHGADMNAKNYVGYTPLMQASQDTITVVQYLVENGAAINAADEKGNTPFRQAAEARKMDICRYLLGKGAKVEKAEDLLAALQSEQTNMLQLVLEQGVAIDATDAEGYTALHKALLQSKTNMAAFLLEKGARINEKIQADISNIQSPEVIELLLNYGLAPSPAMLSVLVKLEKPALVQAILAEHPQLEVSQALVTAVSKNDLSLINFLLQKNNTINYQQPEDGRTALFTAVCAGKQDITKLLLAHKANPDVQDTNGWTPLMDATFHGSQDMVELLLANGAKTALKNKEGQTALDIANIASNEKIISLLENAKRKGY